MATVANPQETINITQLLLTIIGFLIVYVLNGIKSEIKDVKQTVKDLEQTFQQNITSLENRVTVIEVKLENKNGNCDSN